MAANLQNPAFTDENKAREALEAMRWPNGPVCPHCGSVEGIAKAQGKAARPGLYYCAACNDQFTVTVGTVMERSHVPLTKWWMAMHLMGSSKKGMSAHQMHRMLGVSYKTAWFMCHRIREAMRVGGLAPMGGAGQVVEVDETFIGRRKGSIPRKAGWQHKNVVLTLVERGGSARSFHIDGVRADDIVPLVQANLNRETAMMTDEAAVYREVGSEMASHDAVNHARGEYGRGTVHTNTVEGFYSIFKRGMKGVYQHCGEQHLHRYLAEFDFRYSNRTALGVDDVTRVAKIAKGIEGKRLTYRLPR